MQQENDEPIRRSRRWFVGALVAGVASTMVGGQATLASPRRKRRAAVRSFDVIHDPSVRVSMTNGRRFVVCAKDARTGEILERHERVTARRLLDLSSDHFQIVGRT
jgi:hypothetical protein